MTAIAIKRVERLELAFAPRPWPFAETRRVEIERRFAAAKARNPALWNGRVLLLGEHGCDGAVFRGQYFETDFASFLAWRDLNFPDPSVNNCFGMGALRAADGAFLLGVMSAGTASAGAVYFPAGMVDPSDVVGERIDLAGSVVREVEEETGITPRQYEAEPDWYSVFAGPRIAQIKLLHARESAAALRAQGLEHLAREQQPELADIRIVRTASDLDRNVPPYVAAFLEHIWSHE